MLVLLVKPGEKPCPIEVENDLYALQDLVGGLIEVVSFRDGPILLVCNEEGLLLGLPPNKNILGRTFAGTVFFCRRNEENFDSLSDSDIENLVILLGRG